MAVYTIFYLAFFMYLESSSVPVITIHCALDDLIPFCKYAIFPYYTWFAWIVCTLFWLLWFAPAQEFWRTCLPLFAGMTLSLLICMVVPNGLALRPASVPGDDLFAVLVRGLYSTDTPTNVCPSIHVFNAVTLDFAYQRSVKTSKPSYRWIRAAAHILDVAIILSTMLLKQHSVIDVVCGFVLAVVIDRIASAVSVSDFRFGSLFGRRADRVKAAAHNQH
jgi:membrane-associated phospholipid phosphatase